MLPEGSGRGFVLGRGHPGRRTIGSVEELTRREALRILELGQSADVVAIKRAYRRLARQRHPDLGGDPRDFHRLRVAYERLLEHGPDTSGETGRSSRPRNAPWAESPTRRHSDEFVDLSEVAWNEPLPAGAVARASVDLLARILAAPDTAGPVHPATGRSRGPRSLLNRFIRFLDPDLTATWRIASARTRGQLEHDVELRLRIWSRAGRRRVEGASLPPGWTATRGSSSTTIVRVLHPSRDRRATALRTARSLEGMLAAIDWPLDSWHVDIDEPH